MFIYLRHGKSLSETSNCPLRAIEFDALPQMSFFDFAQSVREKPRTSANPFFKHFDVSDTQPPQPPPVLPTVPFSSIPITDDSNIESLPIPSIPLLKKPIRPSLEQLTTEGNIEEQIRQLEEGFSAIQNWAHTQTATLEALKTQVDEAGESIASFLTGVRY
jgi:hypothetical protein